MEEKQDLAVMQKETMAMMNEYIAKLEPKMTEMVEELRTDMKEDTWEFLRMMIDGFNWVLEGYNGVASLINAEEKKVDEVAMQKSVEKFSKAFCGKKSEETADIIEQEIVPFLQLLVKVMGEYL